MASSVAQRKKAKTSKSDIIGRGGEVPLSGDHKVFQQVLDIIRDTYRELFPSYNLSCPNSFGPNGVTFGQDINDILFLDEKEKAAKERLEEEHQKKLRKPRPRDVIDIEQLRHQQYIADEKRYYQNLKREQKQAEFDKSDLQRLLETEKIRPREAETGTGGDYMFSYDLRSGELKNFRPKSIQTFDMKNTSGQQQQSKYGVKGSQAKKPRGGGWKSESSSGFLSENDSTTANTTQGSRILQSRDNSQSKSRRTVFRQGANLLSRDGSRPQSALFRPDSAFSRKLNQVIVEDVQEHFHEQIDGKAAGTQFVSDKFLQYLIDAGIPIASIAGQPVEVPPEIAQNFGRGSRLKQSSVNSLLGAGFKTSTMPDRPATSFGTGTATGIGLSGPVLPSSFLNDLVAPTPQAPSAAAPMPRLFGPVAAAASAGLVTFTERPLTAIQRSSTSHQRSNSSTFGSKLPQVQQHNLRKQKNLSQPSIDQQLVIGDALTSTTMHIQNQHHVFNSNILSKLGSPHMNLNESVASALVKARGTSQSR